MLLQSLLLFLASFLGGMAVLFVRKPGQTSFQRLLVFSGGYLFAITVLHILPELYAMSAHSSMVGCYILAGFFVQLLLELLSKGVEHGHMYDAPSAEVGDGHHHPITAWSLLLSLCVHAFLDGIILSSPHHLHHHHHHHSHSAGGLLIGIILHKVPVALALASVLRQAVPHRSQIVAYLIIFALASPLGLWASHYCSQQHWLPAHSLMALFALAGGSFLHIATTIFFESSPDHHHLNVHKFMASLAGAGVALLCEVLL